MCSAVEPVRLIKKIYYIDLLALGGEIGGNFIFNFTMKHSFEDVCSSLTALASLRENSHLVKPSHYPICILWLFSLGVTGTSYESAYSIDHQMARYPKGIWLRWGIRFPHFIWRSGTSFMVGGLVWELPLEITLAVSDSSIWWRRDIHHSL